MDDPSDLRAKITAALVSMGAWGGTAAAAALIPGDSSTPDKVILAAGLGALAASIDKLPELHRAFSLRNWFRTMFGFSKPGEAEEQATRAVNAAMLDANGQTVLFEVLRRMNEAADPNVLPAIGKLLREYVDAHESVDAFFRGAVRLLLDLKGNELLSLKHLLRGIVASRTAGDYVDAHVFRGEHFDFSEQSDRVRITVRPQTDPQGYRFEELDQVTHGRRLVHLLLANDLAVDPGLIGGFPALAMARSAATRLLKLVEE
jgi:hypothetical protein